MKSEKGFTFIEVLLTFVVIGIIASTIILPFMSNLNDGTKPDINVTASQLAQTTMEGLRGQGFANVIALGSPSVTLTIPMNGRSYDSQYSYTRVDASFAPNPAGTFLLVVATVTETNSDPDVTVTLDGIISQKYN